MSEYTPTRQELVTALVYYRARGGDTPPPPVSELATSEEVARYLAESERGIAEVERAAAEKAWYAGTGALAASFAKPLRADLTREAPKNPYRKDKTDD